MTRRARIVRAARARRIPSAIITSPRPLTYAEREEIARRFVEAQARPPQFMVDRPVTSAFWLALAALPGGSFLPGRAPSPRPLGSFSRPGSNISDQEKA